MGFMTAAAVAGVGMMGYGLWEKQQGQSAAKAGYAQQQQGALIQAQAAQGANQLSKEQAATSVEFAQRERGLNIQAAQDSVDASNQSRALQGSTINYERE